MATSINNCSTWNLCYCEADIHCPEHYRCVHSAAFPEHRICRTDRPDQPESLLQQAGVKQELGIARKRFAPLLEKPPSAMYLYHQGGGGLPSLG